MEETEGEMKRNKEDVIREGSVWTDRGEEQKSR